MVHWRFPWSRRGGAELDARQSALVGEIRALLGAHEAAISKAVVRDLERAMQDNEDRRVRRQFYATLPLAVLVIGAGLVYLREQPAVAISLSSPTSGFTEVQLTNPIGPSRRLARVVTSVATVEPSAHPSLPRPSERRVLLHLIIEPRDCARLPRVGGYCDGPSRQKSEDFGDTLRLHWAQPVLLNLTYRPSASMFTVARDGRNISTLIDGSAQVLDAPCITSVRLTVQRPGSGREELDTCPQEGGTEAWVSASYSVSEPPLVTFTQAQSFSTGATSTRLRGVLTSATLQYAGTSRSVGEPNGTTFDVLADPSSGGLQTRIDGSTGQSAQGVAASVTVEGKQILMSRYTQQRDVWLAIFGLAASILAPIWIGAVASKLRKRKRL